MKRGAAGGGADDDGTGTDARRAWFRTKRFGGGARGFSPLGSSDALAAAPGGAAVDIPRAVRERLLKNRR